MAAEEDFDDEILTEYEDEDGDYPSDWDDLDDPDDEDDEDDYKWQEVDDEEIDEED